MERRDLGSEIERAYKDHKIGAVIPQREGVVLLGDRQYTRSRVVE